MSNKKYLTMLERHRGYSAYLTVRALFGLVGLGVLVLGDPFTAGTLIRVSAVAAIGLLVDILMRATMYAEFRRAIEDDLERKRQAHAAAVQAYMQSRQRNGMSE